MRIISLLPGATEIISLLGLEGSLVGVSHQCDYPASVRHLPNVTKTRLPPDIDSGQIDHQVRELACSGTSLFELDRQSIRSLLPDLIITQSLCSVCAVSESEVLELADQLPNHPKVLRLNPTGLADVLTCVQQIGTAADAVAQAAVAVATLQGRIDAVVAVTLGALDTAAVTRKRVLMLEWLDPLFCAGHWNPELVELAGGIETIGTAGAPSRRMEWDEVLDADPDVMIIACCGLSIDRTLDDLPRLVSNRGFAQLRCIDQGQVFLMDGDQYFNRPGPRLIDSLELLAHTLHPTLHSLPSYLEPAVRMKREPRLGR